MSFKERMIWLIVGIPFPVLLCVGITYVLGGRTFLPGCIIAVVTYSLLSLMTWARPRS